VKFQGDSESSDGFTLSAQARPYMVTLDRTTVKKNGCIYDLVRNFKEILNSVMVCHHLLRLGHIW
jgi:hypothetical protein